VPGGRPRGKFILRLFVAHGLAYPISFAWALGSMPAFIVWIVSKVGTTLDDAVVGRWVLMDVCVPAATAFLLAHGAGLWWGLDGDEARGRRRFLRTMALLGGVPVVFGGASWIWLMLR
jgi:hypothetical protein